MPRIFVTGKGKAIEIGRELGKGGEGSVYEIATSLDSVAKIYNKLHQPDTSKQAKLRFMATTGDTELLKYTAWPQDTLHETPNGPVVGFLMPKVSGRAPIHMLYNPAHRRQNYPQAAWDFLVFAARNIAAAFTAIHQHGHVVGDVNQNNVLVGADSKVVLIDADSFQINAHGTMHLCGVGVPEFTPPELHGCRSFEQVSRTSNHDNFGLALLIFHLLFGGRHPYVGVPLRADAGESLGNDIQAFRYAYAPNGRQRGFTPPPRSIPIGIVSDQIQNMFTVAFTEDGPGLGRATAKQWVEALDLLREKLKRCVSTSVHVYPDHLGQCPWCILEKGEGVVFFEVRTTVFHAGSSGFSLQQIWRSIEAISLPPPLVIPNVDSFVVTPTPLPPGIKRQGTIIFWRIVLVAVAVLLITVIPKAWLPVLAASCLMYAVVGDIGGNERRAEQSKRTANRNTVQQKYDQIVSQVQQNANPEKFAKKKHLLACLRDEYQQLPEREKREMAKLHRTAEARQKRRFLERQFIDSADIPRVGSAKKAALHSFGIQTAADVTWNKVMSVKGFGEVLTRAVVDWQKACERRFVFNPRQAVTEADKNSVRSQIAARQRDIEIALMTGAAELQRMSREVVEQANTLLPQLDAANRELAQALADLKVF